MNLPTIIVLLVVAACAVLALRSIIRDMKKGNFCSGCGNSCGGGCTHCAAGSCEKRKEDYEPGGNSSGDR